MNNQIKNIVIVGGGTAGWLSAGIIAAEHNAKQADGINITLVESPNIATIGVGEGTWPTMRATIESIGISEFDFIRACDVSFKQGSKFIHWHTEENDAYYHPFVAPHGFGQSDLIDYWQENLSSQSFAHTLSFQPHLCDNFRAPKQIQTPEFAGVANYGYHLNAGKFSNFLKQHCVEKLKVKHVADDVTGVIEDDSGFIEAINTNTYGKITGDLFIDCTGTNALLLNKHYQIPLISQKKYLFNDRALAVQVPYQNEQQEITPYTVSTAHDHGWIWDIGLPHRRGVGCVYAHDYCDDNQAEKHLKQYLADNLTSQELDNLNIKKLSFEPGYREKFWHKNCVAVGMAAGFIEPLEASALALIELSAKMIAKELPANKTIMPITEKRFNKRFHYRWQRIIDFLKLHYVLSKRQSEYWQANREQQSIPVHLQELLTLWQYQEPSYNDFTEIEEIFPAASYQYILYGMGFKTASRPVSRRYANAQQSQNSINENQQIIQRYLAGLPSHRELINHIIQQPQRA